MRAARSMLCVAISAASPEARTSCISASKTRARRCAGRGCRSARRPAARAARWRPRGRWRRAAARRPRVPPGGASRRSLEPEIGQQLASRARALRALRQAADHLRHHHVLQRRELRQQVVELVDEADLGAADARCARHRQSRGVAADRHRPRRRPAAPAGRRYAAASTCRRRTARPARPTRPARSRARRRRGCRASLSPCTIVPLDACRTRIAAAASRRSLVADRRVTRSAAPRPDRAAPRARPDRASRGATAPAPSPRRPSSRRHSMSAGSCDRK